ncbi:DUF5686 and carboxypeptidase regulatory-like domain-containing protein [Sphingobacterium sp. lm-10]|uniref:DUF5686 and carboxypeptidase-like regulatory domain-containing protein n=1 Tax=Sphingobacterium sp. lm-10 TaxID=2944904 RepID=UPI0020221547|nr:DUF5686 and carboxypeptidase-like regulatory domain-containing protein [Sphingobacterium sp. lm-10]MCL7986646.1 DUF5686 and carboxypeptidase regulatory-like domain-containing protein [Sphingobacterium sp. lm-10]
MSFLFAQNKLTGKVTSISSGLPIAGVVIRHVESNVATSTNSNGEFIISIPSNEGTLLIQSLGYDEQSISLTQVDQDKAIDISLSEKSTAIEEVVIRAPKRRRYTNKNNATVDFIRKVIAKRDDNNSLKTSHILFSEYEKLSMSLGIANEKRANSKLLKKFSFLEAGIDTVKLPGRSLVPIYMNEKIGIRTVSQTHDEQYQLIDEKQSRVDQFIDEDGVDEYLEKIYGSSNVYENDIAIGNRRFLSPIASLGPSFYKYYEVDTLNDTSPARLKIQFVPRNPEDALFSGYLYIDLDGSYALSKAELTINDVTNINWVKSLEMEYNYAKNKDNKYFLNKSVVKMDLGVFRKGMDLFGEKVITRTIGDSPTTISNPSPYALQSKGEKGHLIDWEQARPEKLSSFETQAYNNIDSLKNSKSFRRIMSISSIITSGYVTKGLFEIGPIPSFYSFNPIEGNRFKFGGNTTDQFSKKLVLDGYGAYGTRDKKFKYNLAAIYSLNGESVYKYPVSSISVGTSSDIQIPGQELNFLDNDNFLLSFRRGRNDRMIYHHKIYTELHHEFDNHTAFKLGLKRETLNPAGLLRFYENNNGSLNNEITTTAITASFRWAPGEKIYQGKRFRRIINVGKPVMSISGEIGLKGPFGSDYNYQRFIVTASKRFFMSQLGFSDVNFESGIQFGKVPYPLAMIHRANQTYAYQANSFNLMNNMEFMSDRYASLQIQHGFNGFILNKIPLINKLDLREWISVKTLFGHIDKENRAAAIGEYSPTSRFPGAVPMLYGLDRGPYIEGSVGLGNIFKVLRIDLVRRFTYTNNPMVSKWGIRAKIGIDF